MLTPDSRYNEVPRFAPPAGDVSVFEGLRPRMIAPATGVVAHTLRAGDRLDLLARHYYNDDRLWWRILDANPQLLCGGPLLPVDADPPADWIGRTIVIPRSQET